MVNICFRWSWSGGENLKIILLGSEGLTKELAEEIEQDNQSHDGSGGSDNEGGGQSSATSSALEVIKVEEEYSDSLKEELLKKRPHGCIAVYSNRKTFQFFNKKTYISLSKHHKNTPPTRPQHTRTTTDT